MRLDGSDFCEALEALKYRKAKIARKGWNGKGMWLELQVPDANSKMTLPYIFMVIPVATVDGRGFDRVPWLASQTDLLANDWIEVL